MYRSFRLYILVSFLVLHTCVFSQVVINEFMASNSKSHWDIEEQGYSDWIELYNAGVDSVDLSGFGLTDNLKRLRKWRIPTNTIVGPGQFLVLWADGKNHDLHTNFNLNLRKEAIGLSDINGNLLDSLSYEGQRNDVSFGRMEDGGESWSYFKIHSAGHSNKLQNGSKRYVKTTAPEFSIAGGFVQKGTEVRIMADHELRYTLDGSTVTLQSAKYTSSLRIDSTMVVRARAFPAEGTPSQQSTQSYFVGVSSTLPVISITTDSKNLWDRDMGIYVNGTNYVQDKWYTSNYLRYWRRPSNIEMYEPDGSLGFSSKAMIKVFGIYTSRFGQKPLTVYFDDPINHKVFPMRENRSFESLIVRNSGQDWIRTLFCDGLVNSLVLNSMDLDGQAYRPAIVYINGQFWGVNNIREKINEFYFAAQHNIDPENVLLKKRTNSKELTEFNEIIDLAKSRNATYKEKFELISDRIDVSEFTNYQIVEIFGANRDWPNNNVKVWKPKGEGKWRWVLVDLDVSFGIWNNTQPDANSLERAVDTSILNTELLHVLLQNEQYKNEFIQRFALSMNTLFSPDRVNHFIDSMANDIRAQIPAHVERWKDSCSWNCGIESVDFWQHNVNKLKYFADNRPTFMKEHLKKRFKLQGMTTLKFSAENGDILINDIDWGVNPSGDYFKSIPMRLSAIPKPGYKFSGWEGGLSVTDSEVVYTPGNPADIKAVFVKSDESILPASVEENLLLTKVNSPYVALGDVLIASSATLSAEPGVVIRMFKKGDIIVNGGLELLGSKEDSVIIEANSLAGANSWGAICLDSSARPVRLSHTIIKDATHGHHKAVFVGAVGGRYADISIEYSRINDVHGQPFYTEYGSTSIRYSKLHTRVSSDIINVKHGKALVEFCDLKGNNQPNVDGIDYDDVVDGVIRGNKIYDFIGSNSDGVDFGEGTTNAFMEKNRIINCSDKGVSVGQKSQVKLFRNVIIGCTHGVGIKDSLSTATIDKCVFYKNNIAVAVFEKNNNRGGGIAKVTNSILSQSRKASVFCDSFSELDIQYSISDMDMMGGEGNMYADPMFASPGTGEFSLREGSPGLGAGTGKSFLDLWETRDHIGMLEEKKKKIKMHALFYVLLGAIAVGGVLVFGK